MSGNPEQAEYWNQNAGSWVAVEEDLDRISQLFTPTAIDALAPAPGERVVDVGCGTGRTTIELARRVSPGGQAVGVDIADGMLARARELATATGSGNASFQRADAQVDELGETPFDAAFSRFGVMFFADPVAAFANLHRWLQPGGRLAFLAWQQVFENEWMLLPGMAVVTVTGQLPPLPGEDEPGPFSLQDPDRIRAVLDGAGFGGVQLEALSPTVTVATDGIEGFIEVAEHAGALRESFKEIVDDETRTRIRAVLRESLLERAQDGAIPLKAGAWLVTAYRP